MVVVDEVNDKMFQRDLWKMELHRGPGIVGAEDMWVVRLN